MPAANTIFAGQPLKFTLEKVVSVLLNRRGAQKGELREFTLHFLKSVGQTQKECAWPARKIALIAKCKIGSIRIFRVQKIINPPFKL